MPADVPDVLIINIIAALPPTIAALATLVTAWRLKEPVNQTRRRAEQLYNGEFARGREQGHLDTGREPREFTQS